MPTISMNALETAFAKIEQVAKDEVTFVVADCPPLTLRVMIPEEENAVQQFSAMSPRDIQAMDDAEGPAKMQYIVAQFDKFKLAVIAQAVAAIGDTDLRNVQYVETGEELPNGVKVKITRAEAMRGIVGKWTRVVRDAVYRKYAELLVKVEIASENIVKFDPADLDTEIERLTARLDELVKAKAARETKERGLFLQQVQAIASIDAEQDADAAKAVVEALAGRTVDSGALKAEEPQKAPPVAPQAPSVRQSIIPGVAAPPVVTPAPPVNRPVAPSPPSEEPIVIPPQVPQKPVIPPFEEIEDSFMGDEMGDEVAAANRRLALARQGRPPPPVEGSMLTAAHQRARQPIPPHVAAKEAVATLQEHESAQEQLILANQRASLAGKTAEGIEVYRLPVQDMTDRGAAPDAPVLPRNMALNPAGGSRNPRFNPPRT